MNIREAEQLVIRIEEMDCGGRPLAIYDGSQTGKPFGESRRRPVDTDPGVVLCRSTNYICVFSGGSDCPKDLHP